MREVMVPVHCCCTPGLRFGFLQVKDEALKSGVVMVTMPLPESIAREVAGFEMLRLQMRWILLPLKEIEPIGDGTFTVPVYVKHKAFDSGDQPLEHWRKVPGFIESSRRY